jgi:hypothetical protein
LYKFTRVELAPFTAEDTGRFIVEAIAEGNIQSDAAEHLEELHRISEGSPRILEELLVELASREYKMDGVCGLDLLDLDRRIHAIDRAVKTTAMERRS